jgi:hypothetical protein
MQATTQQATTKPATTKRIVWKHGLGAGLVVSVLMAVMLPLCMNGVIAFEYSQLLGYSAMVLAFVFVFFAIRSYRDTVAGGSVTFGRALGVGLLVTLVASGVYVVAWEVVYWGFLPDFAEQYGDFVLEKMRAEGASEARLAAEAQKMARFAELYKNPLFNVAVTFLEIFPVGLVVSLVSAGILRRRGDDGAPATAPA